MANLHHNWKKQKEIPFINYGKKNSTWNFLPKRGGQEGNLSVCYNFVGVRGVMVIVVGMGHGDTSSNPGRDWLHFT